MKNNEIKEDKVILPGIYLGNGNKTLVRVRPREKKLNQVSSDSGLLEEGKEKGQSL